MQDDFLGGFWETAISIISEHELHDMDKFCLWHLQVPFFDLEDPHHNHWVLFQSIVNPTPPVYLRRFLSHNCALEVFGGTLCATSCNRQ